LAEATHHAHLSTTLNGMTKHDMARHDADRITQAQ
jgi:hypothetical protein